jgi:hypothetical protein
MSNSLNEHDCDLLRSIAALRVITVNQLAMLSGRNEVALRARVRQLVEQGLVQAGDVPLGGGRGRPGKVLGLTAGGIKSLRSAGIDVTANASDRLSSHNPSQIQHQLLISGFRAQLSVMTRCWPEFQIKFLLPGDAGVAAGADDGRANQIPDAVLALTHTGLGRTLLFFLEADRGTETLASRGGRGDIRQKILNYQARFRSGEYKRYEPVMGVELKGFRVLFLADKQPRLASLCRVVRETPPSDFIWLTDEASLSTPGIGAPIWVRGGRTEEPRQSILGSKMPTALEPPPSASSPA